MLGRGVTTCTAAATAGNVKMRFTPAVKQNITKLLDIKVFYDVRMSKLMNLKIFL